MTFVSASKTSEAVAKHLDGGGGGDHGAVAQGRPAWEPRVLRCLAPPQGPLWRADGREESAHGT